MHSKLKFASRASYTQEKQCFRRQEVGFLKGKRDMTGQTGSYMYMAPEVFNSEPYNEKVDVFSYGCMLSEVFCRQILSCVVSGATGSPEDIFAFACKVLSSPGF